MINYLKHCLRSVIQFQQQRGQILSHIFFIVFFIKNKSRHQIHTRLSSYVESISNFYSTNIFEVLALLSNFPWYAFHALWRHVGLSCKWDWKKMARLFFKTSQCIFFMVLIAFCLRYVYFIDYLNWHSIQIFLTNNLRYQDFKSLLEKNYIWRGKLKELKKAILKLNKLFQLDISLL